uniref:Putative secreted protein n=1 Tax=Anopheles darlingi TaxID=43151 RepID=A0A2M4DG62_ANODA
MDDRSFKCFIIFYLPLVVGCFDLQKFDRGSGFIILSILNVICHMIHPLAGVRSSPPIPSQIGDLWHIEIRASNRVPNFTKK